MNIYQWGWIAVMLQTILLLAWLYNVYKPRNNKNDAAGKGLAKVFILALLVYVLIQAILMLMQNKYCAIVVLCMSAVPLLITVAGLIRYATTRPKY
jgi:cell division protein FtsW (lipid II flippase)